MGVGVAMQAVRAGPTISAMSRCPVKRVARLLVHGHDVLDQHACDCGDRVLAFALNPADHEALAIVELWGIPVLGWDVVDQGRLKLVCESDSVLIPPYDTVEDIEDSLRRQPAPVRPPNAPGVRLSD